MTDLNRLLQRLSDSGIEFVVVGGFAATLRAVAAKQETRDQLSARLLELVVLDPALELPVAIGIDLGR